MGYWPRDPRPLEGARRTVVRNALKSTLCIIRSGDREEHRRSPSEVTDAIWKPRTRPAEAKVREMEAPALASEVIAELQSGMPNVSTGHAHHRRAGRFSVLDISSALPRSQQFRDGGRSQPTLLERDIKDAQYVLLFALPLARAANQRGRTLFTTNVDRVG